MRFFKDRYATIDQESVYPRLSLTKWGDPVLLCVDKEFKKAQQCAEQGKYSEAIRRYKDCISLVIEKKSSLFIDQYVNILLQIAYNHADLERHQRALTLHQKRATILQQADGWESVLPKGLEINLKQTYGRKELLAQCYQEIGITLYHLGNQEESKEAFSKSSTLFDELHYDAFVCKNYWYIANLASHHNIAGDLIFAGAHLLQLSEPDRSMDMLAFGKTCLEEGYALLGQDETGKYLQRLVKRSIQDLQEAEVAACQILAYVTMKQEVNVEILLEGLIEDPSDTEEGIWIMQAKRFAARFPHVGKYASDALQDLREKGPKRLRFGTKALLFLYVDVK